MDYLTNKGIYKITCTANGKFYIGSSVNLRRRHYEHFHKLQTNAHANKHMQSAYNKHGSETFIFEILEVLPETIEHKQALIIEQKYLDELNPCDRNIGFNMCRNVGNPRTCEEYVCSEETRQKRSKSLKGKPKSEQFKQFMSELTKGRSMKERTNNPDWTCNKKGKTMKEITGDPNWTDSRIGRNHSQEAIDKMSKSKSGENNPSFKKDKISFINEQGEMRSLSRHEWRSIGVYYRALLNGSQKSSKGWSIPS
jgi:group I intron endonuclease